MRADSSEPRQVATHPVAEVALRHTVRSVKVTTTADEIYARFSKLPGSEHIASANAINVLLWTVERWRPTAVLEVGAGIGTLTSTVVRSLPPGGSIRCVEPEPFCVDALTTNLGEEMGRVGLVATTAEVPTDARFGLIIVDGGAAERFTDRLAAGGVVFVEGDRAPQRRSIEANGRSFVRPTVRSTRRATLDGPVEVGQTWEGGCTVYKFEPTRRDRLRVHLLHAWNGTRSVDYRRRLAASR
jgi:protein-L-isoaspartate O-methyltransferase